MARWFHPERVEYDIMIPHPDQQKASAGIAIWMTTAVDSVSPKPMATLNSLKDYALGVVPRLQDFAAYASTSFGNTPSTALRLDEYCKVRVMLRDKEGAALAKVYADGRIALPGELDPELRGQLVGLVNVGLPMVLRTVDQGDYGNALEMLVKARSVVSSALQAVLNIAVSAPEPVSQENLAAALHIKTSDLDHWYAGQAR